MAWNDGITKQISEFINDLNELGDIAVEVGHQVIDEEVTAFTQIVSATTPIDKGDLKRALKVRRLNKGSKWYGYSVSYEGENKDGESYEKIANILNYGRAAGIFTTNGRRGKYGAITGTFFLTKAIKSLKGLSWKIEARIEGEIAKRT